MTRILITGGPRTGKTTLANKLQQEGGDPIVYSTDDVMHLGWSEASAAVALWLDADDSWIVEGVAASRALRKWRALHPDQPPPIDRLIYLREPHETLTPGQRTMAKGVETVHRELEDWLAQHGVTTEYL